MTGWSDGLGRTIVIATIAGSLFAGFLALAPRLPASEAQPGGAMTATTMPVRAALPGISDPAVAVPGEPIDVQGTVITGAPTSTVPTDPTAVTTIPPDPGFDGSIELTVEASNADDSNDTGILVEGDEIQWRFRLTNASDEELWGAFVYLELHGPTRCEAHNLQPGEYTDCWIATRAVEGTHVAEAWATAWTTDRIVKADLEYGFQVSL